MGINKALQTVRETGNLPVPLHLRNAPTKLMAELGYADGYKYSHDYPGHFAKQQFLPDGGGTFSFWMPQDNPVEAKAKAWMQQCWGDDKPFCK
jgi:putative ATPase